jgi:hypothetical protein
MSRSAPGLLACLLIVFALVLAACGDDDGGGNDGNVAGDPSEKVAQKTKFPDAGGQTLAELREGLGPGPVLAPAVSVLTSGGEKNRFAFGLFDESRKQITSGESAVYVAPTGGGEAQGPFYATNESLNVKPPFRSETVSSDPDAAKSINVAQVPFETPGTYEVMGVVKLDDRIVAADPAAVEVIDPAQDPVPGVGDKAVKVVTPTVDSANGDIASIDTRVPPAPDLHKDNLADVLGKKPVLLLFATPALCQSRVCGPVVDLLEQVRSDHKGDMSFIFMEIYNDNELERGFRKQVTDWGLPTEPWAFAIDKNGKVAARLEGAYSEKELRDAIAAAEK